MSEPIWYAVHTRPRKEGLVDDLLRSQGFETLYLRYSSVVKHARKTRVVMRSYFSRYIFAGVTDGLSVPTINRTIGVSTVVYLGDEPLEIPLPVIEELRARGNSKGLVKLAPDQVAEHRRRFRQGEQVRITDGPLAGLFAIVALDKGHAVSVWLDFFGGKVEALFDPTGLRSGSPERWCRQVSPRQSRR